jgi:L-threonylcarbamoyladenylate synthase
MESDINNAVKVLKAGGTILYPTDTIWGIGCDATNTRAVNKIYNIKSRSKTASFIVLLGKESLLPNYVQNVPDILSDLLSNIHTPTTIIYPKAKNLAKNVIAADGSIGIRIPNDEFCGKLLSAFGKPIVSTSANLSGDPSPIVFKDISKEVQAKVDYVVESKRDALVKSKASTIIRLHLNGEFEILRQ